MNLLFFYIIHDIILLILIIKQNKNKKVAKGDKVVLKRIQILWMEHQGFKKRFKEVEEKEERRERQKKREKKGKGIWGYSSWNRRRI
jgi:hypothetical protein